MADKCVVQQQDECGGAGGAQQASGVCVGEEGLEDGDDGSQCGEQCLCAGVWMLQALGGMQQQQRRRLLQLRTSLHGSDERASGEREAESDGWQVRVVIECSDAVKADENGDSADGWCVNVS